MAGDMAGTGGRLDGGADLPARPAGWAKGLGGGINTNLLAATPDGQILIAGNYEKQIDFGDGPQATTAATSGYLARLSAEGVPLHSRVFADPGGASVSALAVDSSGAVVVAGTFNMKIDFGSGPIPSKSPSDLFLARYETSGKLAWVKQLGTTSFQSAAGVAVGADGSIALCGRASEALDFGGGIKAGPGLFLVRYDTSGTPKWAKTLSAVNPTATATAINERGDVFFVGDAYGSIDLGRGPVAFPGRAAFVAAYDRDGAYLWSHAQRAVSPGVANSRALALGRDGALVLGGIFSGSVDLGAGLVTSHGDYDAFLSRYAPDGSVAWVRSFGGPDDDGVGGITISAAGDLYATGWYSARVDFGGQSLQSRGAIDGFVLRYSASGALKQLGGFGGPDKDAGDGIGIDGKDRVTVTGLFQSSASFDPGMLTTPYRWGIYLYRPAAFGPS